MFGRKKDKKKVIELYYKDKVKITKGFYSGQVGTLMDKTAELIAYSGYVNKYQIKLNGNVRTLVWVYEYEIKKIT